VDDVECIFVDLLNDHVDLALAPNVVHVAHIHQHVNFELAHLALLLFLCVLGLPLLPVGFNLLVLAVFHKLVNDVVNFEADLEGLIAQLHSLRAEKVAHEARLLEDQIVRQARIAVRVTAKSSDRLLHKLETDRADKLIEGVFCHFEFHVHSNSLTICKLGIR